MHAPGEEMTDDRQFKNKITVSWLVNADFFCLRKEKHPYSFHAGDILLSPTQPKSFLPEIIAKQRMTTLLSLVKRLKRLSLFFPLHSSIPKSPDVPWSTLKRNERCLPTTRLVMSRSVLWCGACGFKSTQGKGIIHSSFSGLS